MALTPAARLRQQAAELIQLADELDRAAPAPAPGRDRFFLDTGRAMTVARKSSSWLYKNARVYRFGWQLPSGGWAFSESRLRAFMAGHTHEKSDGAPLPASPESDYSADEKGRVSRRPSKVCAAAAPSERKES